jgi:pimeloyl-ACP methyl ester carboxylesterase
MQGTEKTLDTGEVMLNYFEGPNFGPPLIFLHGLTMRHQPFEPFLASFSSQWHVFAIDLRGHGRSGRTLGRYHVLDYARDIITFIENKCIEPVILIGHSFSGLAILEVASQIPKVIRGLIPLDPALYWSRNQPNIDWPSNEPILQFYREMKQASLSLVDMVTAIRQQQFFPQDEALFQEIGLEVSQLDIETIDLVFQNQALKGWNLEQVLQKIPSRTLHVYGNWDRGAALRDEDAAFFKANLPQTVDVKIPDSGHMFPIMRPKFTADIINTFLNSL